MNGKHVLIVEDEFLIADEMVTIFAREGASIIGPAPTLDAALKLLQSAGKIDAAILDIRLQKHLSFPVARKLLERGIPFIFATGYDDEFIPEEFHDIRLCEKPVEPRELLAALEDRRA
jgi:DNA-binding response OmpR family regulator